MWNEQLHLKEQELDRRLNGSPTAAQLSRVDDTNTRRDVAINSTVQPIATSAVSSPAKVDKTPDKIEQLVKLLVDVVSSKATAADSGDDGNSSGRSTPPAAAATVTTPTTPASAVVQEKATTKDNATHRRPYVKLGTFDGSESWETFLMKFETCATFSKWGEEDKLMYLMAALVGPAAQSLHSCKDRLTYTNLLEKLHRRYASEHQFERYRQELRTRRNGVTRACKHYAMTLRRWRIRISNCTAENREELFTLPAFVDAIADRDLRREVWKQKPKTVRDALTEALRIDA